MNTNESLAISLVDRVAAEIPGSWGFTPRPRVPIRPRNNDCHYVRHLVGWLQTKPLSYDQAWWLIDRQMRGRAGDEKTEDGYPLILHALDRVMATDFFHATPFNSVDGIREKGLMTGHLAKIETTGWHQSHECIHGSLTREDAHKWIAGEDLLGDKSQIEEWAIIRFSLPTNCDVYQDTFSRTGYILSVQQLPKGAFVDFERIQR